MFFFSEKKLHFHCQVKKYKVIMDIEPSVVNGSETPPLHSSDELCSVNSLLESSATSVVDCLEERSGCETESSEEIVKRFNKIKNLVNQLFDSNKTMSKRHIEDTESFVKEILMKFDESTRSLLDDQILEETVMSEEFTEDVDTTSYLSDEEEAEMFLEVATIHEDDAPQECKTTVVGASCGSIDIDSSSFNSSVDAPVNTFISGNSTHVTMSSGKSKYEKIRDNIIAERNEQLRAMGFFDELEAAKSDMVPKKSSKTKVKEPRSKKSSGDGWVRRSERLFLSSSDVDNKTKAASVVKSKDVEAIVDINKKTKAASVVKSKDVAAIVDIDKKTKAASVVKSKDVAAIVEDVFCSVLKKQRFTDQKEYCPPYSCKICGKMFKRKGYLINHKTDIHGCSPASTRVGCKKCGKMFKKRCFLLKHINRNNCVSKSHEKSISCDQCDFSSVNLTSFKRHKQKAHREAEPIQVQKIQTDKTPVHSTSDTVIKDERDLDSIDIFTDDSDDDTQIYLVT